jgi:hypothetical protein
MAVDDGAAERPAGPVTCSWCGAVEPSPPLGWTTQADERGTQWFCAACTRSNLRAVEAKLPTEWW